MANLTQTGKRSIYLDHNATTPLDPEVRARLLFWADAWGNPSSIHQAGRGPKALMRDARSFTAKMIGAQSLEVIFTSCGSESNNTAIMGVLNSLKSAEKKKRHILSSRLEHPSVRNLLEHLSQNGYDVEYVPVDRSGELKASEFARRIRPGETALISCMLANNETGVLQPVKEITRIAHESGVLVHTDAVQALGKIPVDVKDLDVDYASFAGHKFYALKGAAVLYVKKSAPFENLIFGGAQERHRRSGTENTLAITALGYMCSRQNEISEKAARVEALRNYFENRVLTEIESVSITGLGSPRLGSTSSLLLPGTDGESLLMNLDMEGIQVSTGAACSSGSPEPSPVLLAMGLSREEAQCSLRVGIGWGNTQEEIDYFVDVLKSVVARLRLIHGWKGEMSRVSC